MSLEKFFYGESGGFLFVSVALFPVRYDGFGSDCSCFVVRFSIVCGALPCCQA